MSHKWTPYFALRLEKLGVKLTDEDRRKQVLQFAGLGAASTPLITGAKNLISHGKISPFGSHLTKRWLPAQLLGGALAGGAIPAVQHALAQRNIENANTRATGERALQFAQKHQVLAPALGLPPKVASLEGQDLRLPFMGGVKPPTQDSKGFATKQLRMSSAEVGPVQPSTRGAKLEDILPKYKEASSSSSAPYQQARKGRRPIRAHNLIKKADDMDPITTDPLVQYLMKAAAQKGANNESSDQPPKKGFKDGAVEDNLDNLPADKGAKELSSEPPEPTPEMEARVDKIIHPETKSNFDNKQGIKAKHTEKDHSYDPGVVDRVLGL